MRRTSSQLRVGVAFDKELGIQEEGGNGQVVQDVGRHCVTPAVTGIGSPIEEQVDEEDLAISHANLLPLGRPRIKVDLHREGLTALEEGVDKTIKNQAKVEVG